MTAFYCRDYPKHAGKCRRPQHPSKSRGKAKGDRKGARALGVELNHRLASWQAAAANAGVPAGAAVERYLAEYLGWEDGTDIEDEGYGEPATYGEAVGDEECYLSGCLVRERETSGEGERYGGPARCEEPVRDEELVEGGNLERALADGVWMWGMLAPGVYNVDVVGLAEVEVDQEEEEEEEQEEQEVEIASIDNYERMVKWKKRQQKRKKIMRKQQQQQKWKWNKGLYPASMPLCDKTQEEEEEEEEMGRREHQTVSDQHMEQTKQEERLLDGNEEGAGREDHMEPREAEQEEVVDGEKVANGTEREGEAASGEMLTGEREQDELGGEEVEKEEPGEDLGFCKVGFLWDYMDEEDWCVVGEGGDLGM